MPPTIAATCWPTSYSPPGHSATTPTASIPRTRGNVTPEARPRRVCSSERLRPNALTLINTQPAAGAGTASSRSVRESGGPGPSSTIARIVSVMVNGLPSLLKRNVPVISADLLPALAGPLAERVVDQAEVQAVDPVPHVNGQDELPTEVVAEEPDMTVGEVHPRDHERTADGREQRAECHPLQRVAECR